MGANGHYCRRDQAWTVAPMQVGTRLQSADVRVDAHSACACAPAEAQVSGFQPEFVGSEWPAL
jgi:hypothetical protein